MHDRDRDNWREIVNGVRPVTWADFVGTVDGASYLSDVGRDVLVRVVHGFEQWIGDEWLQRALTLDGPRRIPSLARSSPPMTVVGGEHGTAGAFVELVRWWACIETQKSRPGAAQVRKDLLRDVTLTRLLHTLTQLRLGAVATQANLQVRYEPSPGDLIVSDETDAVTIEVFAMRTSRGLDDKTRANERMFGLLDDLSRQYHVHFHGDLPDLASDHDAWAQRVRGSAAQASRLGIALAVTWAGQELVVEPGDATEGTILSGPAIELDVGSRLRARASHKARQVANAPSAWLWLENHGAVDMLVLVDSLPIDEQLAAYQALLAGATDDVPSVKGITVSSAGQRKWPPPPRARAVDRHCEATSQPLVLDRVRTTFHLPTADDESAGRLMRSLIDTEAHWLDAALASLDAAKTATDLVRPDLRPR